MKFFLTLLSSSIFLCCPLAAEEQADEDLFGPQADQAAAAGAEGKQRKARRVRGDQHDGPGEEDLMQLFKALDSNGDGSISADEFKGLRLAQQALMETRRAAHEAAMLEQYDINANGVLDPEEQEAAQAKHRKEMMKKNIERLKEHKPEKFAELDTNSDGTVDDDEMQAVHDRLQERIMKRIENNPELKARLDKNKDGTIDQDELKELRKMQQRKRGQGGEARRNKPGRDGGERRKRRKDKE